MQPIAITFRSKGFEYDLVYKKVYRDARWCIYRQTKAGTDIEKFEVVKLKIGEAKSFMGMEIPEREVYPCSEDWGTYGWTCADLESAHRRLQKQSNFSNRDVQDASQAIKAATGW